MFERSRFRGLVAALAIGALVLGLASPAAAARDDGDNLSSVPIILDVLILRPLGLVMTAVGVAVYVFPVAPLTAITRPSDLGKPLGPLVAAPGRFTFGDPLGQHP